MKRKTEDSDTKLFLNLVTQNQRLVFRYILSIVPNYSDAEDIYQDTVTSLWEKFDKFERDSSFTAWACVTAKYKALQFIRKSRKSKLVFDDDILELLSGEQDSPELKRINGILKECIDQLQYGFAQLIEMRYQKGWTVKKIASFYGKSIHTIYRRLNNIHLVLLSCIERKM
ncbi:sigma-70 family RNA polymerase sigma factor [Sedimentisphaera salicampi]|uniref:RNA polymerase sigma factor SigV n=1 Tax=Sedimentisphaera salicampi TaxID=1941349 RepID=A0A1W6LKM2_9BACT|nr:sigma-70 family RNA polymerase sigma factor [Sedimentisphaera salicampi]ARN56331.1 RNA polymerase sigma factor SigV [Sedimentisphaera salicampi]OXU15611.1 RNA polymerase sigma factor SigV [Sedimentisphaera salicampi]